MNKNPEEAIGFLNYVVEVSRGWDEPNARDVGRMKSQPNAKGEMYVLNEDIDMKAKVTAMTRRLEELEMKKVQEVQAISETPVQAMPCSICQSYEHLVEECPTIPTVREMFGGVSYKQMLLVNSSPITMLHMETPTIRIGRSIQISLGNQSHLSTHNLLKHLSKPRILNKLLRTLARLWETLWIRSPSMLI